MIQIYNVCQRLKTTNTIYIKEFVDEKELDPIMIEKSYFIAPTIRIKMIRRIHFL